LKFTTTEAMDISKKIEVNKLKNEIKKLQKKLGDNKSE
jgi:hypothetical protein